MEQAQDKIQTAIELLKTMAGYVEPHQPYKVIHPYRQPFPWQEADIDFDTESDSDHRTKATYCKACADEYADKIRHNVSKWTLLTQEEVDERWGCDGTAYKFDPDENAIKYDGHVVETPGAVEVTHWSNFGDSFFDAHDRPVHCLNCFNLLDYPLREDCCDSDEIEFRLGEEEYGFVQIMLETSQDEDLAQLVIDYLQDEQQKTERQPE